MSNLLTSGLTGSLQDELAPEALAHLERDRWRELRLRRNRKARFILSMWYGERPCWAWSLWQCRKWEEVEKVLNKHRVGHTWTHTYDMFRRLTSSTDPLGRTARTKYHPNAEFTNPLAVVAPSGERTTFTYDLQWNLLQETRAAGTPAASTRRMAYDKHNNLVSITDPMAKTTLLTYDNRNRKSTATDPLGNITRWTYDTESNVITETRPDGGVTRKDYDTMNRLVKTTDPKGQATTLGYEAGLGGGQCGCASAVGKPRTGDQWTTLTDARGNTYTRVFDAMERLTAMLYPGGSRE